jgi:hypothetical protein
LPLSAADVRRYSGKHALTAAIETFVPPAGIFIRFNAWMLRKRHIFAFTF